MSTVDTVFINTQAKVGDDISCHSLDEEYWCTKRRYSHDHDVILSDVSLATQIKWSAGVFVPALVKNEFGISVYKPERFLSESLVAKALGHDVLVAIENEKEKSVKGVVASWHKVDALYLHQIKKKSTGNKILGYGLTRPILDLDSSYPIFNSEPAEKLFKTRATDELFASLYRPPLSRVE